jgi:hypothetical protein
MIQLTTRPETTIRPQSPSVSTGSGVGTIADRQVRLLAVALIVLAAPSLGVHLYTQPPSVSSPAPPWADSFYQTFQSAESKYNDRADDLFRVQIWNLDLSQAKPLLRNERVNVYITDSEGRTAAYSFRFDENVHIDALSQGTRSDATVRVVMRRETVQRIGSEYTQTRAVREAYLDGDIQVTGVGLGNWIRYWVVEQWIADGIQSNY